MGEMDEIRAPELRFWGGEDTTVLLSINGGWNRWKRIEEIWKFVENVWAGEDIPRKVKNIFS